MTDNMTELALRNFAVTKIACKRKVDLCVKTAGRVDMPPCIVFSMGDEYSCVSPQMNGHPVDNLPMTLAACANGGFVKFDTISFISEGYMEHVDDTPTERKRIEMMKRGDFKREFETNPTSGISEVLMITTYGWDGGQHGTAIRFGYDDNGVPQFTTVMLDRVDDLVIGNTLRSFIEFCHRTETQQQARSN